MADKINVPIVSTYDDKGAKKALDDAKKLDQAKPEVKVTADTKAAVKDIDGLMKKVDLLDKDTANILLATNAQSITGEIADLLIKIDKLDAEDPEVTVSIDRIEALRTDLGQVEQKIQDINQLEVKPNFLAAKQSVDDTTDSFNRLSSANSSMANTIGNTSSEMGGMLGIAGPLGQTMGEFGEYMSEALLEGEKLGTVLKSFAAIAGPIAVIAAVFSAVSGAMEDAKARAEAAAARQKAFGQALQDSADDTVGLTDALRDMTDEMNAFDASAEGFGASILESLGEIGSRLPLVGGLIGDAGQEINDLVPVMEAAGLSIYDVGKAIEEGGSVTGEWQRKLSDALKTGKITEDQYNALSEAIFTYSKDVRTARDNQEIFNVSAAEANEILGEIGTKREPLKSYTDQWKTLMDDMRDGTIDTEAAADAVNFLAEKLGLTRSEIIALGLDEIDSTAIELAASRSKVLADQQDQAAEAADRVAQAMRDEIDALHESIDEMRGAADASIALEEAQEDVAAATANTIAVSQDAEATAEDLAEAIDAERDAMIDAANASVEQKDAFWRAQGVTMSATDKVDAFNDSLLDNARNATPAARDAIANYIIEANNVPAEKATDIRAAIARGDFDEANRLLDEASEAREAAIIADAKTTQAETDLNNVARDRTSRIAVMVGTQQGVRLPGGTYQYKRGGVVGPWGGIVAEAGPEFVRLPGQSEQLLTQAAVMPPGTQVTSAIETARILEREISGPTTNVTVNVPRGYHGNVLEDARKAARRSGGLYRRNRR